VIVYKYVFTASDELLIPMQPFDTVQHIGLCPATGKVAIWICHQELPEDAAEVTERLFRIFMTGAQLHPANVLWLSCGSLQVGHLMFHIFMANGTTFLPFEIHEGTHGEDSTTPLATIPNPMGLNASIREVG